LTWANPHTFKPDLAWIMRVGPDVITNWSIILPQQKKSRQAMLRGHGPLSLHGRAVDSNDRLRGNSTSIHRNAVRQLDAGGKTGKLILYPMVDRRTAGSGTTPEIDPTGVVMAIVVMMPQAAAVGGPLQWQTKDSSKPAYAYVDD